jgi:hypothetical protein
MGSADSYLRSARRAKRRRALPVPEPELDQKPAPLITQGVRSSALIGRKPSPDDLIREDRAPRGNGGWTPIA